VILTLVIPDPPPTREHPGRAASRGSPDSEALVRAGEALIQANPGVFPRMFTTMEVVFGKTMPDVDPLGYQPDHPIYEVLQDVGVVVEPGGWSSQNRQDPSADFYVVTFTLEDEQWQPPSR
jgi:hypothetical protein